MTDRAFRTLPLGIPFWRPSTLVATWFGVGMVRHASGTWGSLAALPFGLLIAYLAGPFWLLVGAAYIVAAGAWAAHIVCREEHDSSVVVVDEVAGQWIALVPAGLDPVLGVLAFLLFRLFDIAKPWPASAIDRNTTTGLGVMLDDVVAGIYAAAGVYGASLLL